ncbi:conserved repeat domain protein [Pseudofrankia inefficax]|uniref:Conserved repeat domain protein n=1 Tax=Pseudofrankia inefficax (strain DSM 45817 / CECT 9037 / DDB 130130 / EuI1c) TaxID=298654 RepID=E3IWP5_PSEI1|nr:conserved repeat domain protein [Pseudofrankia inefficax]
MSCAAVGLGAPAATAAPVAPGPAVSLAVSPLAVSFASPGTQLFFQYPVTNTGGQTLTGVTVRNTLAGVDVACLQTTLGAGQATQCLARYFTTAADVARGGVTTTATATGLPPTGAAVTSSPSSVTIPALAAPALAPAKRAFLMQTFSAVGEDIPYAYRVDNTGNAPLTGISVQEPHPGLSPIHCQETTLAPGAATACFAVYRVTTADLAAGEINNTATASGTPPSGPAVTSNPAPWTMRTPQPWLSLTKSVTPTSYSAGTPLRFSYVLNNTGNVALTNVTVTDALPGLSPVSCPATVLVPRSYPHCCRHRCPAAHHVPCSRRWRCGCRQPPLRHHRADR